jgi:hypothetical protein
MNKYEQLIEFILNEQEDKASALFHEIVVETSRGIYENLIDEDDLSEVGGNQVDDLVDEVTMDEQGMAEAEDDEFEIEMGDDDMDMDPDAVRDEFSSDDHHADVGGDEAIEDRVMDLEDALDELKSEFDALMGDGAGNMDNMDDMDNMDSEEEMMEADDEDTSDYNNEASEDDDMEESVQEAKMSKKDKMLKDKKEPKKMTESEWIREYVEKMGDIYQQEPAKGEGKEVGKGGSATVATKSIVAGKNNMGGTTQNIARGGAEYDPDNKPVPQPNNQYTKGKGNLPGAGQFKNVPGAKGDSFKSKAPAAQKGEQGGTNDKSPLAK